MREINLVCLDDIYSTLQSLSTVYFLCLFQIEPTLRYSSTHKSLILGKSCMGTTVYVDILEDETEVAVKRMVTAASKDTAKNELEILRLINTNKSPFIVSGLTVLCMICTCVNEL